MEDATEFGKAIRELMAKNNLRQGQMAKRLGVSEGCLSNYITGKTFPEMGFLKKCIDNFNIQQKSIDMADFFLQAFLSGAQANQKAIIDTRLIDPRRWDMLAKILTVLILYPVSDITTEAGSINDLRKIIEKFFSALKNNTELLDHSV